MTAEEVAGDPDPGPVARAFLAYEAALADAGGLDVNDLVGRALRVLKRSEAWARMDPLEVARLGDGSYELDAIAARDNRPDGYWPPIGGVVCDASRACV